MPGDGFTGEQGVEIRGQELASGIHVMSESQAHHAPGKRMTIQPTPWVILEMRDTVQATHINYEGKVC